MLDCGASCLTKKDRKFMIVEGRYGWYRIEKDPEGHWLIHGGPYWSRDEARYPPRIASSRVPSVRIHHPRPAVAYGLTGWHVVTEIRTGLWADLAGPFRLRGDARWWILKNPDCSSATTC